MAAKLFARHHYKFLNFAKQTLEKSTEDEAVQNFFGIPQGS